MDFDLSDEQQATIDVAAKLLGDKSTPDAIRLVEQADDRRFDRDLWAAMADAGLLGIAVPAEHGGAGLGVLDLAMVLEEVGRRTTPVPALATLALGALPVARFGTPDQQAALLPGVVAGTTVLTAALAEPLAGPGRPTTVTARRDGDAWVLDGTRSNVPAGLVADTIVVPAATEGGDVALFLVPADAEGVGRQRQDTTSGTPNTLVTLTGVDGDDAVLGPMTTARPCAGCSSTPPWPPAP